jgi:lipoprotein-anchoring transpeptidase ErfK/SrfK
VSIRDQRLALVNNGEVVAKYPVSTSRFGEGDGFGSCKTPTGNLVVCNKIGHKLPPGAVIKRRAPTGEVLKPNAPGRDPIVSRVIWLRGTEESTRHAYRRCIYIHGTAEERRVGTKASFGCVRMRSKDVIALFDLVSVGTPVTISEQSLRELVTGEHQNLVAKTN